MKIKKIIFTLLICSFVLVALIFLVNMTVKKQTSDYIISNVSDLPISQVAIVLGAKVYQSGRLSDIFQDRVDTGLQLYNEGKVSKILVSGDHGQVNYDEVNAAKNYLLQQGVPATDIFLDHAGFDTYDSMYRARDIFEVDSAIVVSQDFHLPRAVYIAKKLGLQAYGFSADKRTYMYEKRNQVRERLARVKAWFDLLMHSKPKYLGEAISIQGDGQLSWD